MAKASTAKNLISKCSPHFSYKYLNRFNYLSIRLRICNILVMLTLYQYDLEYFAHSTNRVTATFFFSDLIQ